MSESSLFEVYGGAGLEGLGSPVVLLVAGGVLLVFGRRLYWLVLAGAGFGLGFHLSRRFLEIDEVGVALAVGVLAGLLFAASAVLFQKIAVAVLGFVAGGLATLYAATALHWEAGYWILAVALAAGIGGALLARSLFELALVVSTSIAGAALCVPALGVAPELELPLFAGLAVLGAAVQLGLSRGRGRRRES